MVARKVWHILYPCLTDKEWIVSELQAGKSRRRICRELGCNARTLREAMRSHGLKYPVAICNNEKLTELEKKIPK